MRDPYEIIKRPVITEKATLQKERENKVTFEVARDANKAEIKEAVERLFNVKVEGVNVMNVRGKRRRLGRLWGKRPDWKKAIVTLKPGYSIDFFEGT
ncbi:MAG: 50S ribosomal protein L23 [Deltaproteobacteria bacterium]|mgnify:CR=1 FL=1|nr:MAG: 50S ribosomal protein L23 [Deltaproteobacteria bacterium]RLB02781.1 MAG: 50S ribosomal protein L23 [Deltaproteobacteria bacterium]